MKTIIYLSHGKEKYHYQTKYSVLSLLGLLLSQNRTDYKIVIYTDRPDLVPEHDYIECIKLYPEELITWKGPLDYVHRIKLEILRRAAVSYNNSIIYIDSDTRWLALPDRPFDNLNSGATAYMHKLEYRLTDNPNLYTYRYYNTLNRKRSVLRDLGIDERDHYEMWNAGVIGLPRNSAILIDKSLQINDILLLHSDMSERWIMEQLAQSLVLTEHFQVRPLDHFIEHWWFHGTELPILLCDFFKSMPSDLSVEQQAKKVGEFPISAHDLEFIQNKKTNKIKRDIDKFKRSVHKRKVNLKAFILRQKLSDWSNSTW